MFLVLFERKGYTQFLSWSSQEGIQWRQAYSNLGDRKNRKKIEEDNDCVEEQDIGRDQNEREREVQVVFV